MANCYRCNRELDTLDYGRADRCLGCGFDTRVCKNCEHYDAAKYNECTEPVADRITDKEKSNFCDYFKPGNKTTAGENPAVSAKRAADALFKKMK